jgi:hypothetical protein
LLQEQQKNPKREIGTEPLGLPPRGEDGRSNGSRLGTSGLRMLQLLKGKLRTPKRGKKATLSKDEEPGPSVSAVGGGKHH